MDTHRPSTFDKPRLRRVSPGLWRCRTYGWESIGHYLPTGWGITPQSAYEAWKRIGFDMRRNCYAGVFCGGVRTIPEYKKPEMFGTLGAEYGWAYNGHRAHFGPSPTYHIEQGRVVDVT